MRFSLALLCFCWSFCYANSIKEHVLDRIEQSEIIDHPFPALVIDHFFPDEFYQEAICKFPPFDSSKCGGNRCVLPICPTKEYFSKYTQEQQAFWGSFHEFMNEVVKPALVKKFEPLFLKKFELPQYSDKISYIADNFKPYCDSKTDLLCLDRGGYELGTHVDQIFIYLKVIVYFPDDESMSSYGTYMVDCDKRSHGVSYLQRGDRINGERLIEYKPNRLVVMMQTPISWHRVQPLHFSTLRRTYNGNIYVDFDFLQSVDDDSSIIHKAKENDYPSVR